MRRRAALVLAPLALALGCEAEIYDLFIDLKTDYVTNIDFGRVETTLELADGTARTDTYDTIGGEDFAHGARVAEIAGIPAGEHRLRVRLVRPPGEIVDEETILLSVQSSFGVLAVLTRACRGRDCPGPGDPATFRQCIAGRCEDERCSDVTPDYCSEPFCDEDADCVPAAACAMGLCDPLRGFCTFPPAPGACHETEWCNPDSGCELLPDLYPDTPAMCGDFDSAFFDACALPAADRDMSIEAGEHVYDTDTEELTDPMGMTTSWPGLEVNGALVVAVGKLAVELGATLRVVGDRPLVIAAFGPAEIDGTVDVSSHGSGAGAGSEPDHCGTHRASNGADDTAMPSSAGGGGGGGYQGEGGDGGGGTDMGTPGGSGGLAHPLLAGAIAGGCSGGRGGLGTSTRAGGGGSGGGAVLLSSARGVIVTGVIHSGGAAGGGGNAEDGGGGGGGSGGLVMLEAGIVIVTSGAILAANGGGGGPSDDAVSAGVDGQPSWSSAAGGMGGVPGGSGGNGSGGTVIDGFEGAGGGEGGGGGGGGAGYVVIRAPVWNTQGGSFISPGADFR